MKRARGGIALCLAAALGSVPGFAFGAEPAPSAQPPAAEAPADATDAGAPEAAAAPGEPTKEQCIDANETAQRLLRAGSLANARAQVAICMTPSCPELVKNDCGELSKAIQAALPTVRFDARDKKGAAVTEVRVTMDGTLLVERLDGTPVAVDPGKHKFLFESPGLPRTSKVIVLKAGEQRGERVNMVDMTGPLLRTTGLVIAGIGVITVGYGAYRGISAKVTYDDAVEHCPNGPDSCTQTGVNGGEDAHDDAAAATTAMGVGAFLLAGGLALYVFVPEEGFRITPGVQRGGLSIEAAATW